MLPLLLVVLAQTPDSMRGDVGESCRFDADCMSALRCSRSVCAVPAVKVAPPKTVEAPKPTPEPEPAEEPVVPEEPKPFFEQTHFFVGASFGAGPVYLAQKNALSGRLEGELRLGVRFNWFELSLRLGGGLYPTAYPDGFVRATVSVGALPRLYKGEKFSVLLPLRIWTGPQLATRPAAMIGADVVGVVVQFNHAEVELNLFSPRISEINVLAFPITLSASYFF